MKKTAAFFIALLLSFAVFAQTTTQYDTILKTNGDEMTGSIKEISDTEVKFSYKGETAVYTIKKSDIFKITFSSGRTEVYTKPVPAQLPAATEPAPPAASTQDHHNRIAILPFRFYKDNQGMGDDMGMKVQNETYTYLSQHSPGYTLLDPRTTNALLMKAGATSDKIAGFTMADLCNILGVEFVIDGSVTSTKGAQQSYSSGSASQTNNYGKDGDKTNAYGSSSSTSYQNYKATVTINVYNDKNVSIYNKTHEALLATNDGAYDSPLQYLLKRCPFYKK
jgi:hypothetical protein